MKNDEDRRISYLNALKSLVLNDIVVDLRQNISNDRC